MVWQAGVVERGGFAMELLNLMVPHKRCPAYHQLREGKPTSTQINAASEFRLDEKLFTSRFMMGWKPVFEPNRTMTAVPRTIEHHWTIPYETHLL